MVQRAFMQHHTTKSGKYLLPINLSGGSTLLFAIKSLLFASKLNFPPSDNNVHPKMPFEMNKL